MEENKHTPELLKALKDLVSQFALALNELSNYGIIRQEYEKSLKHGRTTINKAEGRK